MGEAGEEELVTDGVKEAKNCWPATLAVFRSVRESSGIFRMSSRLSFRPMVLI